MYVTVISPERSIFDGQADALVVPAYDGWIGVLPGHAPLTALLGEGRLTVRRGDATHAFQLGGGFLQVVRDRVRIVAERAREEKDGS